MKSIFPFIVALVITASCDKSSNENPSGNYTNSVFIVNEGPYPTGTGTILAYDRETWEVSGDIFEAANGRSLGNTVQSMTIFDGRAFIVVNNANKIEVVDLEDIKSIATIDGLTFPRYFLGLDNTAGLVSCWDNTVKLINLDQFTVTNSIDVGTGPDEMVKYKDRIFTVNSGGFGVDSTVSVFYYNGSPMETKITVGHRPAGIRMDYDSNIWVLCSGKGWNGFPDPGDTPAKLICIDPDNLEIKREMIFPDQLNHPDDLIIDKNGRILYYNMPTGIFAFPVDYGSLIGQPFIPNDKMFYGLGFDDKEQIIYAADPLDFAQNGWIFQFNASDGSSAGSFMAGIAPNGFCFFNE